MSAKWVRSKKWDDEHLTGALAPVKVVLRAFSSIPLAVVLLTFVSLYGVLASVPIGLLALAPTWAFYSATAAIVVLAGSALPVWLASRGLRRARVGARARFVFAVLALPALAVGAAWAWGAWVWPLLHYRPVAIGSTEWHGVRFFADFVDRYQSVQFRRLPVMEMSELEFYSWWPLRVVLLAFVANMITATVRRIEFRFVNIGVLTVHSGIITIALGSIVYGALKQEGDMLLQAGPPDATGKPSPGPAERGFYDNTRVALWVRQSPPPGEKSGHAHSWEQRRLSGVPRYNSYNLGAAASEVGPAGAFAQPEGKRDLGPLGVDVPIPPSPPGAPAIVGDDLRFRIVGYADYARLESRWVAAPRVGAAGTGVRMREVEAYLTAPQGEVPRDATPQKVYRFLPDSPSGRVEVIEVFGVEYTRGMDPRRWEELQTPLPRGVEHALVVEHPATGFRSVYPVQAGQRVRVGDTGYTLEVKAFEPRPPLQIVTRGYEGAQSSLAIVRIEPPAPEGGAAPAAYDRWVYHRFPEISQDLMDGVNERGMQPRRDADPSLRITYLDASIVQVYLDERVSGDGAVRALVRMPRGQATVTENLKPGDFVQVAPSLKLKLSGGTDDAARVEAPVSVPEVQQNRADIGTHKRSALAVEVTSVSDAALRRIVWLPFTQYMNIGAGTERSIRLPDGREVEMAFGRVWHPLPFEIRLMDFAMEPYPHSDTPRDYRSDLLVMSRWGGLYQDRVRKTSLNEPLLERVPYIPREDVPPPVNWVARLWTAVVPNQYKFSQAGWDAEGWRQTKAMADAGRVGRPMARFTILGVGNNPGIYVIAAGAVMMSVGIPWAFYVKPAILRYRKKKIQAGLKAGSQRPAGGREGQGAGENGTGSARESGVGSARA
ncbi:MAG: hypothetical protein KF869_01980 [Phycisphaeraceae bacterium]|nr:hypothetical protein [Phycisphaeraceae bacterium]